MLQPKVQLCRSENSYSIPGKVFLLGEYAVLGGLPALVASVGPRFRLKARVAELGSHAVSQGVWSPHPQSPLGRLMHWAHKMGLPPLEFEFEDPWSGAGGFGASTAQFAMGYLAYSLLEGVQGDWLKAWKLYRELMGDQSIVPSGADLVAQWQGAVCYFNPSQQQCEVLGSNPDGVSFDSSFWSSLMVFSATGLAGRKVPTHEHLEQLSQKGFLIHNSIFLKTLEKIIHDGIIAIDQRDHTAFGAAMNAYAQTLHENGLEVEATAEDRKILGKIPGVLGVKGAGALQSDAILVLVGPESLNRSQVIEVAHSLGLRQVTDGLTYERGVVCQN